VVLKEAKNHRQAHDKEAEDEKKEADRFFHESFTLYLLNLFSNETNYNETKDNGKTCKHPTKVALYRLLHIGDSPLVDDLYNYTIKKKQENSSRFCKVDGMYLGESEANNSGKAKDTYYNQADQCFHAFLLKTYITQEGGDYRKSHAKHNNPTTSIQDDHKDAVHYVVSLFFVLYNALQWHKEHCLPAFLVGCCSYCVWFNVVSV